MPEITRVRERRGKARIWVDGEFWAEIDAEVALERGLREGVALGLGELDEARAAGERALAMNRALHFLGYRARSRREVRDRLRRYGYGEETVGRVIGRLEELGYLVDEEFAERSEVEAARSAAARRYNSGGSDAESRRVYGFLMRRGYSADVCAEVAREYRGASGAG